MTVGRALTSLAAQGLIERRHGAGTFVAQRLLDQTSRSSLEQSIVRFISSSRDDRVSILVQNGITEGLHDVLEKTGKHVTVSFYSNKGKYAALLESCRKLKLAGLAAWYEPDPGTNAILADMAREKYPFVLVDAYCTELECDYVVTDNIHGGSLMVDHLASKGHERIVYVTIEPDRTSLRDRRTGFIQGMIERGLPFTDKMVQMVPGWDSKRVQQAIRGVMAEPDRPTAIFASHDELAFEIHRVLREMGLRIPEDVSLAGYDNIDAAEHFRVPLTTVAQPFYKMGRVAASLLDGIVSSKSREYHHHIHLKPKLVVRKSVRSIRD